MTEPTKCPVCRTVFGELSDATRELIARLEAAESRLAQVRIEALEEAAKICVEEQVDFASTQDDTGEGSDMSERKHVAGYLRGLAVSVSFDASGLQPLFHITSSSDFARVINEAADMLDAAESRLAQVHEEARCEVRNFWRGQVKASREVALDEAAHLCTRLAKEGKTAADCAAEVRKLPDGMDSERAAGKDGT